MAKGENLPFYDGLTVIDMGYEDKDLAYNLYTALRQAEKMGNYVISETVDDSGVGYSVMNRMRKAASVK